MALRRSFVLRLGLTVIAAIFFAYVYQYSEALYYSLKGQLSGSQQYPTREILESLTLTEGQCRTTFPGLTKEIDDAVARGSFELKKVTDDHTGLVQARLLDGKLYVISAEQELDQNIRFRNAVLHQMHRASITSPEPLPDTIFAFSVTDKMKEDVWSFSRSNGPKLKGRNYWVMPHFSFWSWPVASISALDETLAKIDLVERNTPFEQKIDKVVWRGTGLSNSAGNPTPGPDLLDITKGKDWADVEVLDLGTSGERANNSIAVEDFCKYKYIIYTEGEKFSGLLPYNQACESVILTPPLIYLMHTTHLIRPLFSSTIPFPNTKRVHSKPDPRWPKSYSPSEANIVFVDPDWSDLEATIQWLRRNPDIARGIAKRQREKNVMAGYLSPAAEACYWRSLVKGWSRVARTVGEEWGRVGGGNGGEGLRWETFALRERTEWDS